MKKVQAVQTIPTVQKWQAMAGSKNLFTALVTIVFGAFSILGVPVDGSIGGFVDAIYTGEVALILPILFTNVVNPITKIIQSGGIDWKAIRESPNFWVQIVTVVLSVLAVFGLILPESAVTGFMDAVIGKQAAWWEIISLVVLHFGNFLYHTFFDDDDVIEDTDIEVIETVVKKQPGDKIVKAPEVQ